MGQPTKEELRDCYGAEDDASLERIASSADYSEEAREVARALLIERGREAPPERPTAPERSAPPARVQPGPEPPIARGLRQLGGLLLFGCAGYLAWHYAMSKSELTEIDTRGVETRHVYYDFPLYDWSEHALNLGPIAMLVSMGLLIGLRWRPGVHGTALGIIGFGAGMIGETMELVHPNPIPAGAFTLLGVVLWYVMTSYVIVPRLFGR